MSGITYDGVPTTRTEGIFRGKSFFINRACPRVDRLKSLVKANGGTLEALESHADIFIHDKGRRDVSPGFVDWQFIEDCVKHGKLLDHNPYVIRPAGDHRPVGSQEHTRKARRTPFTAAEDKDLKNYMISYLRGGGKDPGGNKVYISYEESHPQHPWQSWKSRWRKNLEPLLTAAERESITHSPPTGIQRVVDDDSDDMAPGPVKKIKPPPVQMPCRIAKTGRRTAFTDLDDKLIMLHVREYESSGKGLKGLAIWEELARQHPNHPAQSWRNRFLNTIEPRMQAGTLDVVESLPSLREGCLSRQRASRESSGPPEIKDSIGISGDDREQGGQSISEIVMPTSPMTEAASKPNTELIEKDMFYGGIMLLRENMGLEPEYSLRVQGIEIDPYVFFNTVVEDNKDPNLRNWSQIAKKLGFGADEQRDLPDLLAKKYNEFLATAEETLLELDEDPGGCLEDANHDEEDVEDDGEKTENEQYAKNDEHDGGGGGGDDAGDVGMQPLGTEHQDGEAGSSASPELLDEELVDFERDAGLAGNPSSLSSSPPGLISAWRKRKLHHLSTNLSQASPSRKRTLIDQTRVVPDQAEPTGNRTDSQDASNTDDSSSAQKLAPIPVMSTEPDTQDWQYDTRVVDHTIVSPSDRLRFERATRPSQEGVPAAHEGTRTEKKDKMAAGIPMPHHSGDDRSHVHASSKPQQRQEGKPSEQSAEPDAIQVAMDEFSSRDYSQATVIKAMKAACYDPRAAERALEPLKKGQPIPHDIKGLWTRTDDEKLLKAYMVDVDKKLDDLAEAERQYEARAMKKELRQKHGKEGVKLRRKLWAAWKDKSS